MDRPAYVPLGPTPLPATGAELVERVRGLLLTSVDPALADGVAAASTAELDGPDVAAWSTDATGVVVPREALDAADRSPAGTGAVVDRTRGVVRDLHLHADPMTVAEVPISVDVRLAGIPFDWVTTTGEGVGADPVEPDAAHPVTGTVDARVERGPLLAAVREIASEQARAAGVTITDLQLALTAQDPRTVRVDVRASVRRGILGATVTGRATAGLDDALVLHVRDLELSSPNPLVGAMVAVARSRVEAVVGRPRDLGRHLPPGVRVTDLRIGTDPDVTLHLRLG